LTGCQATKGGREARARNGVRHEGAGWVLTGTALEDGPGDLLGTLVGKIPNFRLLRSSGRCPIITLRGTASIQGDSNPHVYVDGTRTADTCVLRSLRSHDVSRVEVYPQGVTLRPGYGTHAHGLILVFMRSAGG
ncbi:MAG: hypothetical protein ACC667_10460, partial [Longimicrobiales bacterium]